MPLFQNPFIARIGTASDINYDESAANVKVSVPAAGALIGDVANVQTWDIDRYVANFARFRGETSFTYFWGDASVAIQAAAGSIQPEALTFINLIPSAVNGAIFSRLQAESDTVVGSGAVTTLDTIAITDDRTWNILSFVQGDEVGGGGDGAGYMILATVKRVGGGVATQVGASPVQVILPNEDIGAAAWNATIDVDGGNNARVRVTTTAGDTVRWTSLTFIFGEA